MTWWMWAIAVLVVLMILLVVFSVLAATSPQFFTLLNVSAWERDLKRKRKDPSLEEIKDAEGNHIGFRKRERSGDVEQQR